METEWARILDAVYAAASAVVGPITRKHQDWIDDNNSRIKSILEEKNRLHRALLSDPSSSSKKEAFNVAKRLAQSELCHMQDEWLRMKADAIQAYADRKDTKNFYSALKAVYGPTWSGSSPILSARTRRRSSSAGRSNSTGYSTVHQPSTVKPWQDYEKYQLTKPTEAEVTKAIKCPSSGKVSGADSIPAEIYASRGPKLIETLTSLFNSMWSQERLSQELKTLP